MGWLLAGGVKFRVIVWGTALSYTLCLYDLSWFYYKLPCTFYWGLGGSSIESKWMTERGSSWFLKSPSIELLLHVPRIFSFWLPSRSASMKGLGSALGNALSVAWWLEQSGREQHLWAQIPLWAGARTWISFLRKGLNHEAGGVKDMAWGASRGARSSQLWCPILGMHGRGGEGGKQ